MRRQTAVFFSGLVGLIFSAPFFFGAVHPWAYHSLAGFLFLLTALKPGVLAEALKLPSFFRKAAALVLIWICVQALFWAADKNRAWAHVFQWLAFAAAFLAVQKFDAVEIRRLLNVLIATALFQAVYGFWQTLESPERVLWQVKEAHLGYLTGTFINRNHCAGLLELALGVTAGFFCFYLSRSKKGTAAGYGLVFMVLAAALMRTGSRFGAAAFCFTSITAALWAAAASPRLRRPLFILGALFSGILICQSGTLLQRFGFDDGYLTSVTGRVWAWQDAGRMLQDYGLLGTGLGGFGRIFSQYQSARLLMGWDHAHQDYLELASELGLPVLMLWLSAWTRFGFQARAAFRLPDGNGCLAGGIAAALASLALHGLMDFNFAIPANAFLWIFLAGCLECLRKMAQQKRTEQV